MKRALARASLVAAVLYAGVLVLSFLWAHSVPAHADCPGTGVVVVIDTKARVLCLCRSGQAEGAFRVAVGRAGTGKRREGDNRTPLGIYPLGPARASSRYHRFLPVGYPTTEQRSRGLTGSAIGIHGPHLAFAWLGNATLAPDWTRGCIAVGTQSAIRRIAAWVEDTGAKEVRLL